MVHFLPVYFGNCVVEDDEGKLSFILVPDLEAKEGTLVSIRVPVSVSEEFTVVITGRFFFPSWLMEPQECFLSWLIEQQDCFLSWLMGWQALYFLTFN